MQTPSLSLMLAQCVRVRLVVYMALLAALLLALLAHYCRRRRERQQQLRRPADERYSGRNKTSRSRGDDTEATRTTTAPAVAKRTRGDARLEAFVRLAAPLCASSSECGRWAEQQLHQYDDNDKGTEEATHDDNDVGWLRDAAAVARARRCYPHKYEQHDHVVVVRLPAGLCANAFAPLACSFAACFRPAGAVDVVLCDVHGIAGELRQPQLQMLYAAPQAGRACASRVRAVALRRFAEQRCLSPVRYEDDATAAAAAAADEDASTTDAAAAAAASLEALLTRCVRSPTYTTHMEKGVMYGFDASRVMFCSGNTTERMHFATITARDEVVVDMFAGIGYFTLPLAMHGGVAVVHALEKNAESVTFLRLNAVLNGVAARVRIVCGDNRGHASDALVGTCDRVLMGYIPCCAAFLPRAVSFLRGSTANAPCGVVHYHFLASKTAAQSTVHAHLSRELPAAVVARATVTQLRCVKSYAPQRYHFVADVHFA